MGCGEPRRPGRNGVRFEPGPLPRQPHLCCADTLLLSTGGTHPSRTHRGGHLGAESECGRWTRFHGFRSTKITVPRKPLSVWEVPCESAFRKRPPAVRTPAGGYGRHFKRQVCSPIVLWLEPLVRTNRCQQAVVLMFFSGMRLAPGRLCLAVSSQGPFG